MTGFLLLKNEQKWWAAIYHPPPLPRKSGGMGEQLSPLIAAKARANQSIAGGDKKSDSAKSLFPKCEKAIEAIHTDEELAKLSGISKNTIRRARC